MIEQNLVTQNHKRLEKKFLFSHRLHIVFFPPESSNFPCKASFCNIQMFCFHRFYYIIITDFIYYYYYLLKLKFSSNKPKSVTNKQSFSQV